MRTAFFAAIATGLLSSWLVGHQWVAAGLLGLWLARIVALKSRRCLIMTVLLLIIFGSWFHWQNQRFERISREGPRQVRVQLGVQPDAVTLRGGQFQLTGRSLRYGKLRVLGRLTTAGQKRQLNQLRGRSRWLVQGTLSPIPPPTNPGQFDAPSYYRSQRIYRQLQIERIQAVTAAPRGGLLGWLDAIHQVRQSFFRQTQRLPATLRLYATSLLIGLRPADFQQRMAGIQRLGLLYLFSLSGMHVLLFIKALRWGLIRCRLSAQTVDWWLLVSLPVYLILGGGADSLQRAVVTVALMIMSRLVTKRPQSAIVGWSVALLFGLAVNPLVLLQLGGQLSYGLALLLMLRTTPSVWGLAWRIQLLSLPVLLTATGQWHVLTLLLSLLVAPVFSWGLLPVTVIGASWGLFNPAVAAGCDRLLAGFQALVAAVASWPGTLIFGQPPVLMAWGLALLSLAVLKTPRRWLKWLVVAYAISWLIIRFPLRGAVQFIDIGQGDSILIRQPFNRRVSLIDTGGRLTVPRPTWQRDGTQSRPRVATVTVNYLHRLGITHLDTVYLSHKDVDHIGDLGALLQLMPVRRLVVPVGMAGLPKFRRLLTSHPVPPVLEAVAGMQFDDGLTAVHPFHHGRAENQDSLVLTGRFGGQRFLFTGDLDRAGERAITSRYPALRVDVLKLGHHGSKTASDPQTLNRWGVRYGILSVGRHNRYGHPNLETLTTLRSLKVHTYSTALQGMVTYWFGAGRAATWQTFLKEGNYYQRTTSPNNHSQG